MRHDEAPVSGLEGSTRWRNGWPTKRGPACSGPSSAHSLRGGRGRGPTCSSPVAGHGGNAFPLGGNRRTRPLGDCAVVEMDMGDGPMVIHVQRWGSWKAAMRIWNRTGGGGLPMGRMRRSAAQGGACTGAVAPLRPPDSAFPRSWRPVLDGPSGGRLSKWTGPKLRGGRPPATDTKPPLLEGRRSPGPMNTGS